MTRAVAFAAIFYFGIVYMLGFALGAIRVLAVAPRLGETQAVLLEAPLMLAASWGASGWALRTFGVPPGRAGVLVGAVAFVLLMSAEAGLALLVFGRSLDGFLRAFATASGAIGLASQLAFASFPALSSAGRPAPTDD